MIENSSNHKKIKILVTGASGYIGLHCIAAIMKKGYNVCGTIRSARSRNQTNDIKYGLDQSAAHEADLNQVKDGIKQI